MPENKDETSIVPLPGESAAERARIRRSNDRDQAMERQGKVTAHNRGYDQEADGVERGPEIERVVDA